MALIDRLMQLEEPSIAVHHFFAACTEIVHGEVTVAQMKTAFGMDQAAADEFDALAALAPTGTTALATAQKAMFLERVHAVLTLAEGRYATYSTPNEVRVRLGLPTL